MNINFLDIVKWLNPIGDKECQDIMVVEDVDGNILTVRHLSDNATNIITQVMCNNIRIVGHCSSVEPIKNIINRYIYA